MSNIGDKRGSNTPARFATPLPSRKNVLPQRFDAFSLPSFVRKRKRKKHDLLILILSTNKQTNNNNALASQPR